MNLYLKVFLAMSIPFGLLTGYVMAQELGIVAGFTQGASWGIVFGAIVSGLLVTLHKRAIARMPYRPADGNDGVKQTRRISLDVDFDTAFDLAVKAMNDHGCRQIRPDHRHGTVVGKSKLDIFAALQVMGIRVFERDEDRCDVEVLSQPRMPTTLLDYGRNLRNVEELSARLRELVDERRQST